MDMMNSVLGLFNTIVNKIIEWIDKIIGYFEDYNEQGFSKWFMLGIIMYIASLFMKINIKTGASSK